jgi:predicted AlkP superfamily phosphohydrolase/phosphomutase
VHRLAELAGEADARRDRLPDLVVEWGDIAPGAARVIRSDRYGEIAWDSPRLPSGRAGNHRPDGWFVAVGPDIPRGAAAAAYPLVDLAPTVYRWLDLDPDPEFAGRPIPELAS